MKTIEVPLSEFQTQVSERSYHLVREITLTVVVFTYYFPVVSQKKKNSPP